MRNRLAALLLLWSLCSIPVGATEYKPWYTPELVPQTEADIVGLIFPNINTKHGRKRYRSNDVFVDLGLLVAPTAYLSAELECVLAATRHRTFGPDSVKFTGRYLWMDDVVGDPVSISTGASVAQVFSPSRRDLAIIHHGGIEGELHVAVGKEQVCESFWTTRWWGVAAVGMGDIGSPWVRGDLHYGWNCWDTHRWDAFILSLWGLGSHKLRSVHHFHGYGPIRHQSIDVGGSYTYVFDYHIELKAEYSYRVYAKNCPEGASIVAVRFVYPFNL